jgi:nucleotide-binding universal stress UspA family protein
MKNKIIIVPYDFTEEANCAVNHAMRVANIHGSKVFLTHIIDKKTHSRLKNEKKTVADLQAELETIARSAGGTEIETGAITREGDVFHTITEIADEVNAELIVFGTHGVHGMQHLLGAFALKLVTSAKVPVVIVQRKPIREHGYQKIAFPVDENPYSKQKAYSVADFAKIFNAEVLVLPKKNSDEHFQNYTNGNLHYSEKVFRDAGVKYSTVENKKSGSFPKQVIDFAVVNDCDLIAITTQGSDDRDIGDVFVGSEDANIVNNEAEIPTLCINAVVSLIAAGLSGVTGT